MLIPVTPLLEMSQKEYSLSISNLLLSFFCFFCFFVAQSAKPAQKPKAMFISTLMVQIP